MQQKIGVKFKIGSKIYSFLAEDMVVNVGDNVIVETSLGQGYGKVDKIEEYNPAKENRELKKVLRVATEEDEKQYNKMLERERLAIQETKNLAINLKLDMNVVNAEYSLDGSKVIIDFIAEDRVDFRDLVKELATKLKSRIELRQIGIRDQAKMVGGIGICGRVCCCSAHLKDFEKVSIKMAKSQGLALNPTKISGSCGRLMCCLAYEDNYYSEVYPKIPKLNKEVKTPDGVGVVVYTNALKQIVSVKITAKDGSFVIKDYSLDSISNFENQNINTNTNSSLKDYKNFAQENRNIKNDNTNQNIKKENLTNNKNNNLSKEKKLDNKNSSKNSSSNKQKNHLKQENNKKIEDNNVSNINVNNTNNLENNSKKTEDWHKTKKFHKNNKHKNYKPSNKDKKE